MNLVRVEAREMKIFRGITEKVIFSTRNAAEIYYGPRFCPSANFLLIFPTRKRGRSVLSQISPLMVFNSLAAQYRVSYSYKKISFYVTIALCFYHRIML